jgi:hypothetical protein
VTSIDPDNVWDVVFQMSSGRDLHIYVQETTALRAVICACAELRHEDIDGITGLPIANKVPLR